MSNSENDEVSNKDLKNAKTPEPSRTKSTEDSSSDSEDSAKSGSGTGSSKAESASSKSDGQNSDESASESGEESDSPGSEKTNESFKSVNTTLTKANDKKEAKEAVAPVTKVVITQSTDKVRATIQPVKVTPDTAVKPVETNDKREVKSPVPLTPAKALVFDTDESAIEFGDIVTTSADAKASAMVKKSGTSSNKGKMAPLSPGEIVEHETTNSGTEQKVESQAESGSTRKRGSRSEKTVKTDTRSPVKKKLKKEKAKASSNVKAMEKVEDQVRKLQAQLDEVRNSQARPVKQSDKPKSTTVHKDSKIKKAKHHSSDEASVQSSSSDEPTTSTRIAKIPVGRKYQQIAMSRAKQLGIISNGEIHVLETTEALKTVSNMQFRVLATHAYRDFHKVPGTKLPHIKNCLRECLARYGIIVKATTELNLRLAHDQDLAKKQLVVSGGDVNYAPLWQFGNDLVHAVPIPNQLAGTPQPPPVVVQSGGASSSKVPSNTSGSTKKKHRKHDKKEESNPAAGEVTRKRKTTKKKKSDDAEAEEER